jgi:hypothetical protein
MQLSTFIGGASVRLIVLKTCHIGHSFYMFRIGVIDEINYKVCYQNSATVHKDPTELNLVSK